jgi:selenide,water dikinase
LVTISAAFALAGMSDARIRHLVLVGAGHAHVEVLRAFGRIRPKNVRLTVITREAASPYSGMLPGAIAGHYRRDETEIDVAVLARFAGAELVLDEVVALDPVERLVHRADGPALPYDLLSLDIGSRPNVMGVAGAPEHAIPVKPIDRFVSRFDRLHAEAKAGLVRRIVLVGGGAGGVELLLAVAYRMGCDAPGVAFTLISGSAVILPGFSSAFRRRVAAALAASGVEVCTGARVVEVREASVVLASGTVIPADAVLWTTQASAAGFLAQSGLACDADGFLLVDDRLCAVGRDDIFAAGDMISFSRGPIPKSGVYAVRAGPVLANNLIATLNATALRRFYPQRRSLAILATGDRHAVATGYGITVAGRWVWRWKDRIDRRFMARFRPGGFDA